MPNLNGVKDSFMEDLLRQANQGNPEAVSVLQRIQNPLQSTPYPQTPQTSLLDILKEFFLNQKPTYPQKPGVGG